VQQPGKILHAARFKIYPGYFTLGMKKAASLNAFGARPTHEPESFSVSGSV